MNWLRRFMYGRYGGNDQLSMFLFVLYLILLVLGSIFRRGVPGSGLSVAGTILQTLCWVVVLFYFFRCFSKNIYKRSAENQKFLRMWYPVQNYFKFLKLCFRERNGVKKLYRCPKCHQTIRVPRGRGKIAITCPKCRFEFIKKT